MDAKKIAIVGALILIPGCVNGPGNLEGYCDASEAAIVDLAAALGETPDEAALRAGDLVIRQRDAACE